LGSLSLQTWCWTGINASSSHPPQVLGWFSKWRDADLTICRIKNGFATTEVAADGYRDLKLYILFTNRAGLSIIGEIQIHDERLHDLKRVHVCRTAIALLFFNSHFDSYFTIYERPIWM
jgi:hypothetical protein